MDRLSAKRLYSLRNNIPLSQLIPRLELPNKHREDFLRFLCPLCEEFNTSVNPKTNLGRCFRCCQNFNTIDLVMSVFNCSFLDAVKYLERPSVSNKCFREFLTKRRDATRQAAQKLPPTR